MMLAVTMPTEGVWMEILNIGGPAVAIIFALAIATILVFKYGINPGLASFAGMVSSHREAVIESRVAAEASRIAAEASRESATQSVEAVARLEEIRTKLFLKAD